MDYKEIIPIRAVRKFDVMCLHNEYLRQNKEFQQQILSWAADTLAEAREHWGDIHATTIDAVIKTHHREKAHKGAVVRDKKYAQFREKFAEIQKEKYKEAIQVGIKLTANSFVEWFLANKANEMQIPYIEQNQKNKLRQLAQQNNREFKKLLLG
ncbi:MAG: hypothetical protein IKN71_08350 [Alphaproteobacteria bacterium]|jgi:hypothetical protein|nr:hypothetical protein [Alphaproteobacteria bacterium]